MSKDLITFVGVLENDNLKQQAFNASDLNTIQAYIELNKNKDTYTTYNLFKEPTTKSLDNVALVRMIVIDLDNHLSGGFTLDEARVLLGNLEPHFNKEIPTPKYINYSGRGLHYYVEIEPDNNIHKYNIVSQAIMLVVDQVVGNINALINSKLSADRGVYSAERYIRAPGTYNTKAQAYCTGIYHSSAVYTLDSLTENFIPVLRDDVGGNLEEYITKTTWRAFRGYKKGFTAMSWRYSAIDDLKTLQRMRDSEMRRYRGSYRIGNEGFRNSMLFMYGLLCKWAFNDRAQVLESMRAFNTYYAHGVLSDREVERTFKSVLNDKYKPYSARKIISVLEIAPEEMSALSVLIDRTEIKRRTCARVKRYKQNKADSKRLDKQATIDQAIALRATGASLRAIAKELNISLGKAHKISVKKLGTIEHL